MLGLPTEGEVGDRRRVGGLASVAPSVAIDATIADVKLLGAIQHAVAVLGLDGVLLGALDPLAANLPPETPVENAMVSAPGTIRPDVRIDDALSQLADSGLSYTFVTTARGVIVGIIDAKQSHV